MQELQDIICALLQIQKAWHMADDKWRESHHDDYYKLIDSLRDAIQSWGYPLKQL